MSSGYTYKEYTANEDFYERYSQYQQRYAENMRESDKVLIALIIEAARRMGRTSPAILDVGCSTGNFLGHLRRICPDFRLTGGDLMVKAVEECRQNPKLEGIDFQVMDIFDLPIDKPFDIIVASAVTFLFDHEQFERSAGSLSRALRPGGWFIGFEFFHPYPQDLLIVEKSKLHPEGLHIHFRPMTLTAEIMKRQGFVETDFRPFQIGIDLPAPNLETDDELSLLISQTVRTEAGPRLLFRGALAQPWCHFLARKAGELI